MSVEVFGACSCTVYAVYKSVSPVNYGWFFLWVGQRGSEPKTIVYLPIWAVQAYHWPPASFAHTQRALIWTYPQGLISRHSQQQRGVVVIGRNTPLTQTRRKLPQNAQVRFLSFTAANSEGNLNCPSICRHGRAGVLENSPQKLHKQKKQTWPKGMWRAFWWAFYQNDDHSPTGGHHFGMMTMVVIWWPKDDHQNDHGHHIKMMIAWSSYGDHFTPVFDALMTMGLPA